MKLIVRTAAEPAAVLAQSECRERAVDLRHRDSERIPSRSQGAVDPGDARSGSWLEAVGPEGRRVPIKPLRKVAIASAMVASTLAGGALGATLVNGSAGAQTTSTTTPAASTPAASTPSGTFHSNENATHEAGESAAREAQENAGQFPTVP